MEIKRVAPYILIFVAGALDFITTHIGFSVGLIEGDGIYFPFLANTVLTIFYYVLCKFPQHYLFLTLKAAKFWVVLMCFLPVIFNAYLILFS